MKLTKKLEAEILRNYHAYWDAYLQGDMKTFAGYLDNNISVYGTAMGEVFKTKSETIKFYKATAQQMTGKADFRKRKIKLNAVGDTVVINEQGDLYVLAEKKWIFYGHVRVTAIFEKKGNDWKIIHQHASFPDSRTEEGDQIATEKIKTENLQLREAVHRRTVELEEKNRELEIETALEKVRAIAMGMNQPADMLDVCQTISIQLQALGLKNIRNVQTAIFYPARGTYMNYEYYARHRKTFITEVDYTNHKVAKAFATKMLKGIGEVSVTHIKGPKVKEWLAYQKGTNVFIDKYLQKAESLHYYWHSLGPVALGISSYSLLSKDDLVLFRRFLNVFELSYKRHLDIEQALAQAKEARIEASLEKVRAGAMSMQQPGDLLNICEILFTEFQQLGFPELRNAMINIHNDEKETFVNYDYSDAIGKSINYLTYDIHPVIENQIREIRKTNDAFSKTVFAGKDLADWKKFRKKIGEEDDPRITRTKALYYYFYSIGNGAIGISTFAEISDEKLALLKRFRNVFHLAFQRFTDIALAEAQAKEAQIELSLERVRAGAMAMRQSAELGQLIFVLYQELTKLDAQLDRCFIMIVDPETQGITWWLAGKEGLLAENGFFIQANQHPSHLMYLDCWRQRKKKWQYLFEGKEKRDWDRFGFSKTELAKLPEFIKKDMAGVKKIHLSGSSEPFGSLVTGSLDPLPEEHQDIISRFTIAFNQAYTRFLDLQKAEAQAREAQIQLAMERVRARAMAMQNSDELQDAAILLFQQLKSLGIQTGSCGFNIWNKEKKSVTVWMSSPEGGLQDPFDLTLTKSLVYKPVYAAMKEGKDFLVKEVGGKNLVNHFDYLETVPGIGDLIRYLRETHYTFPETMIYHFAFFSQGFLSFHTHESYPEAHAIFKRFALVFEQTYTRFLDLQKAEAQARESQIEVALERVRARTMAMQKSDELANAATLVFQQFSSLGMLPEASRIFFSLIDEATLSSEVWTTKEDGILRPGSHRISLKANKHLNDVFDAWKERKSIYNRELTGGELADYINYLASIPYLNEDKAIQQVVIAPPDRLTFTEAFFEQGTIGVVGYIPLTPESQYTLTRFAKVFEQTYTRFLDLQKAEAQAREAQIEAALERVRSRSMGMQKSQELQEVIQVVYEQFVHLNIPVEHTGFVMDYKKRDDYYIWIADHHGAPSQVTIPYFDSIYYNRFNEAKEKGEDFFTTQLSFEEKNNFYQQLFKYVPGLPEEARKFYFSCPGLAASTVLLENIGLYIENFSGIPFTDEDNNMLMRFGKVFQQTYTRFLDLQKAEEQAMEAQIEAALERVRSRSMAMHQSNDLQEVVKILSDQLLSLGLKFDTVSFSKVNEDASWDTWISTPDKPYPAQVHVPYSDHIIYKDINEAEKRKVKFFEKNYTLEEKNSFFNYFFENTVAKDIPEARKQYVYNCKGFARSVFLLKNIWLSVANYEGIPFSAEENAMLQRFANVFEQAYTRFLDLQKAETQAREAQIETALERVRARAMAMHSSQELQEVALELRRQMGWLDQKYLEVCAIHLYEEEQDFFESWGAMRPPGSDDKIFQGAARFPKSGPAIVNEMMQLRASGEGDYVLINEKEKAMEWFGILKQYAPEAYTALIYSLRGIPVEELVAYWSVSDFSGGALLMVTHSYPDDSSRNLLRRAANVFDLAYRRFRDLKKAEAQSREAQIELGLERVRARAMAMQNSDELNQLIGTVFTELTKLDLALTRCIIWVFEPATNAARWWMANSEEPSNSMSFYLPYHEHPAYLSFVQEWKRQNVRFVYDLHGEDKAAWDNILFNETELKNLPDAVKEGMQAPERVLLSGSFNNFGGINVASLASLSEEHFDILLRFAKVFDLTYTRFNDLKKAEEQAREAQIELALERVRARTMAMQKSEELPETSFVLFEQLKELGEPAEQLSIGIMNEAENIVEVTLTLHGTPLQHVFRHSMDEPILMNKIFKSWKAGQKTLVVEIKGKELQDYNDFRNTLIGTKTFTKDQHPGGQRVVHSAFFSRGMLALATYEPRPAASLQLLERFAKVFDGTYTRFLDLQKAEAQARESKIEMALERVRSRTMAMHKSDELAETASVLFEQFRELGESPERIAIGIMNEEQHVIETWATLHGGTLMDRVFNFTIDEPHVMQKMYRAWKNKEKHLTIDLQGAALDEYFEFLKNAGTPVKREVFGERRIQNVAFFSKGMLTIITHELRPAETIDLLKRFAGVFDLTYTRFLDLKQAEAQAKEAKIEAALERVRSRTLAMQKSDELAETAAELFRQLISLGIEPNRLYIGIVKEESGDMEMWATDEDGIQVGKKFIFNKNENVSVKKLFDGWKAKEKSVIVDMQGKELEDYLHYLNDVMHIPFKGGLTQKRRVQSVAYFSKGFIGMASPDGQGDETIQLLERFAAVFNLTFTRFNDLKIAEAHAEQAEQDLIAIKEAKQKAEEALTELQATQKQLIQSEKMASLGELTAGIAHEIQNPLNFVNNFSEVSQELLDEMKAELDKGDTEEAKSIADDVKQNLEKILHHGKRADGIVKGMLQHSRSSGGQKEPTDINALADEYLRLAYHGLRAKDKSFNATLHMDYDESIGQVSVIPQDIGRAILNLITNAFYIVAEKKKQHPLGFEPTVSVSTKKRGNQVELSVQDNGNGIPQKILDKIFQPFFTTKPTGQGTGLGLSLSYDIVKAHGGEITVQTKEGEGTEFIVALPFG